MWSLNFVEPTNVSAWCSAKQCSMECSWIRAYVHKVAWFSTTNCKNFFLRRLQFLNMVNCVIWRVSNGIENENPTQRQLNLTCTFCGLLLGGEMKVYNSLANCVRVLRNWIAFLFNVHSWRAFISFRCFPKLWRTYSFQRVEKCDWALLRIYYFSNSNFSQ